MMKLPLSNIINLLIFAVIVGPASISAQTHADSLYQAARKAAFETKNNPQALALIQQALEKAPDVAHYRVFYGRLLAWESRYDEAQVQLEQVLDKNPAHLDARLAELDVFLWSGEYALMSSSAQKGLIYHPDDLDILFRLGTAQSKMGQAKLALATFKKMLVRDPGNDKAKDAILALQPALLDRKIRISLAYDRLAETKTAWQFLVVTPSLDPWIVSTLEYEHPTSLGPVIARLNFASRFKQRGSMAEIESYPKLGKTTYAYVGLGVSSSSIYPKWKMGAELFQDFGKGFEGSFGFRYLTLPEDEILVYTGSAGKYVGNYWVNARAFVTPHNTSLSRSLNLQVRRYLADADQFIELSGGSGEIPDETLGTEELTYLGARRLSALWQTRWTSSRLIQIRINLENQEIRNDRFRGMTGLSLTFEQRF